MKTYKSTRTANIRVEMCVDHPFDGQPISLTPYFKAIRLIAQKLGLVDHVTSIWIENLGVFGGVCNATGKVIQLDRYLEGVEILRTVAHELRHAWQAKNHIFDLTQTKADYGFTLNDILNNADTDYQTYLADPCEVDAREFAEAMVIEFGKQF